MTVTHHWTVAELEQLPDDDKRYEIAGADLYVSRQPDIYHQQISSDLTIALGIWNKQTRLGRVIGARQE